MRLESTRSSSIARITARVDTADKRRKKHRRNHTMSYIMHSDISGSNHRKLEPAFSAAGRAWKDGAQHVSIRDTERLGRMYNPFQYDVEKTSDGIFVQLR